MNLQSILETLKQSASTILTQDNAGTNLPAYYVQSKKKIYGIDDNYFDSPSYEWADVADNIIYEEGEDMYYALEELDKFKDSGQIVVNGTTYRRVAYTETTETIAVFFTRAEAQKFIDAYGYNFNKPFIYVKSFDRNREMTAMHELFVFLAENPTAFDVLSSLQPPKE